MHIGINCHTLLPPCTGVQQTLRAMVDALVRTAPETTFSAYVPWRFQRDLLPEAPNLRLLRSWVPAGNRTLRILWEQFFLYSRVHRDGIDLLHAPCYVMPLWCLKPTVVTMHDLFALTQPAFCRRANVSHFKRFMPRSAERAKRIVVPTHAVKREAADCFRAIRSDRIQALPWGVDDRFRPVTDEARREEVALRYGLPPRFVLHVGRVEPKKNLVQVVQAYFAATMAQRLPHRLVLAGPQGWNQGPLDRMVRELGIESKVFRPGYIRDNDMPALYSMAEAFLFPSLAEGFGLPVLEAMACGTPVIASRLPALREVAGDAALLVEPGELPDLRSAIETVLTRPEEAETLRQRGRQRAAIFRWDEHARRLLQLYGEVLAEVAAA